MSNRRKPQAAGRHKTYRLKIALKHIRPPVWRRVEVPGDIRLDNLHHVIQTAMGWSDSHLHEYEIDGERYGVPHPDWDADIRPEAKVRLCDVASAGSRLRYTYDFGDDWEHQIEVESVQAREADVVLPRCLAGRRGCPPEDVGGPWAYEEFLEAYSDPGHSDHEQRREWAGPYFDPDDFDADEVTAALKALR